MGARSSRNTSQNNRSDGHLLTYYRQSFVRGGGATNPPPGIFSATGGTELTPGNGYKYHIFTTTGSFVVSDSPSPTQTEIFLVAGGGGAGAPLGSGGGAGGLVYHTSYPLPTGTYPVTVGAGGGGATGPGTPGTNTTGSRGSNSVFNGIITAAGGGGGFPYYGDGITPPNQVSGGSGGGYSPLAPGSVTQSATQPTYNTPFVPDPNFSQYGYNGSPAGDPIGGSGGGAGGAGTAPGVGGPGRQYPQFAGPIIGLPALNPLNAYFAGGGAAGSRGTPLAGGAGGGGDSSPRPGYPNDWGNPGVQYSGGGAGGGFYSSTRAGNTAASGGDGIVIIRYAL